MRAFLARKPSFKFEKPYSKTQILIKMPLTLRLWCPNSNVVYTTQSFTIWLKALFPFLHFWRLPWDYPYLPHICISATVPLFKVWPHFINIFCSSWLSSRITSSVLFSRPSAVQSLLFWLPMVPSNRPPWCYNSVFLLIAHRPCAPAW